MKYLRQRYILFEFLSDKEINLPEDLVIQQIWKQLKQFFGEYAAFHGGLWMIRYDPLHRKGLLRCDHLVKTQVIAAMALIKTIQGTNVLFHTRKTAGTIRKALEEWRQYFDSPPPPPPTRSEK